MPLAFVVARTSATRHGPSELVVDRALAFDLASLAVVLFGVSCGFAAGDDLAQGGSRAAPSVATWSERWTAGRKVWRAWGPSSSTRSGSISSSARAVSRSPTRRPTFAPAGER